MSNLTTVGYCPVCESFAICGPVCGFCGGELETHVVVPLEEYKRLLAQSDEDIPGIVDDIEELWTTG